MIRQGYGTPTLAKPSKEFVKHKRQSLSPEDSLTRKLNRQSSAFSPPSRGLGRGSKVPPPKSPYGGEAAIFSRSVSRGGEIAANAAESAGCNSIPGLKGMIDDIFDAADSNKDGRVDIDESYVLILKLYIKVNRQAPVNPPSREVSEVLFRAADNDGSGRLNKEEFLELATTLLGRAGLRVAAYKAITLLAAPFLGAYLAATACRSYAAAPGGGGGPRPLWAASVDGLLAGLGSVLPDSAEAAVFSEDFLRTLLMIAFIATLGKTTLAAFDSLLNFFARREADESEPPATMKDALAGAASGLVQGVAGASSAAAGEALA